MNPYRVEIYRLDPVLNTITKLDEIEGYTGLQFDRRLNSYGKLVLRLDPRHRKATTTNFRRYSNYIVIKKNDTVIWAGPITKLSIGIGSGVDAFFNIEAREHFYHLFKRKTDAILNYQNTDAGAIAWELIDHTQTKTNGNLFITEGAIQATVNRDRSYEYADIGQKIIDLSNVRGGFDFDFVYTQNSDNEWTGSQFMVYTNKGVLRNNLPTLEIGLNVSEVTAVSDSTLENTIIHLGAGTGLDVPKAEIEDANLQVVNTRIEGIYKEPDVALQNTLDQNAQRNLDQNKIERFDVSVKLESTDDLAYGSFAIGDRLNVNLKSYNTAGDIGMINYEGITRILALDVKIDKNGGEILTPLISQII